MSNPHVRAAITGAGIVSSLGCDTESFVAALRAGETAIRVAPWAQDGDERYFGYWSTVTRFDARRWLSEQVIAGTDLFSQWAVASAVQAVEQAGLAQLDPLRTAVVHGTSSGGVRSLMQAQHQLDTVGPSAIDRKVMIKFLPNMASAQIAMRWQLHGPQLTPCSACASSIDAIAIATDLIQSGRVDVAVVGATEGGLAGPDGLKEGDFAPAQYFAQTNYGMNSSTGDAASASLPFDVRRRGIVTGEGSAVFVIESIEHARARGAEILAHVAGYASLADGHHPSASEPSGRWQAAAINAAQVDAGVQPRDIDALIAHATATPKGDLSEIAAINAAFGDSAVGLPVMSIKGHIGHSGASSGGMALITAIATMRDGVLPHTAGTRDVEPAAHFDVVTEEPRVGDFGTVQINSFGFGGQNASLVISAPDAG